MNLSWNEAMDARRYCVGVLQMGGPAGVRAAEHLSITMSCDKGMKMHVIPRVSSG